MIYIYISIYYKYDIYIYIYIYIFEDTEDIDFSCVLLLKTNFLTK